MLPTTIIETINTFKTLPGVGKRGAQKLTLDILESNDELYNQLLINIDTMRKTVKFCSNCGFFATENLCSICSHALRDSSKICLVEKTTDVLNIEKTGIYNGHYHVLKHLISPIDNIFAQQTTISDFLSRRVQAALDGLKNPNDKLEIIIFFKSGFACDATTAYLRDSLLELGIDTSKISITKLAEGLPLYYNPDNLDQATLVKALEDRRVI
jgi:recombination protein RecR